MKTPGMKQLRREFALLEKNLLARVRETAQDEVQMRMVEFARHFLPQMENHLKPLLADVKEARRIVEAFLRRRKRRA